jgi:hypothetical protein
VPDRPHTAGFQVQATAATTVDVTGQDPADGALCEGDAGAPALRESGGQVELVAITSTSFQGGCLAATETRRDATQARVDDLGGWIRQIVPALVPRSQLSVRSVDSEETAASNYRATNALDGNPATLWHSRYSGTIAPMPHEIQLDLGAVQAVSHLYYLPRQDASPNGRIARYEVYVSPNGTAWGAPVAAGTLPNTTAEQEIRFVPKSGRYVRLRALSEVAGAQFTSIAELNVGVVAGVPAMAVRSADSEETAASNYRATNALDGNPATLWHSRYSGTIAPLPHEIQLDLGGTYPVTELYYLPRQDASPNGRIARYEVYVSADGTAWGSAVATGTWANSTALQTARFPIAFGRYVRLRALSEVTGAQYTSAAEITVGLATSASQAMPGAVATPGADAPTSAVEGFAYPGAAEILATANVRLLSGDGHILFVDCATPPTGDIGLLKVFTTDETIGPDGIGRVCFKVTATSGWLNLEIPGVYEIRGDGQRTGTGHEVTAELVDDEGEEVVVDVDPDGSTQVGQGADPNAPPTMLLRLTVTG